MMLTEVTKKKKAKTVECFVSWGNKNASLTLLPENILRAAAGTSKLLCNLNSVQHVRDLFVTTYYFAKQVPDKGILKKSRNWIFRQVSSMLLFQKYRVLTDRQWWACSAGPRQHFVLWSAEVPPNPLLRLLRGVPLGSTLREYSEGIPLGSTLREYP